MRSQSQTTHAIEASGNGGPRPASQTSGPSVIREEIAFMKTMIHLGKTLVAIAVTACLGTFLAACGGHDSDAPPVSIEEARTTTQLDKREWRFIQDDNLTDAAALTA